MKDETNPFLKNLKYVHPQGFVEKYELPEDLKDKINPNRMWTIIKSGGKDAKVDEVQMLLEYYTEKAGKAITFDDLFGEKRSKSIEELYAERQEKKKQAEDGN